MLNPIGMKWISATLTLALAASATASSDAAGYSFGMVELALPQASNSSDPSAQFRALKEMMWDRSAVEAELGGRIIAHKGGTPLGPNGEKTLVFAITPQRGVFYILPNGLYSRSGDRIAQLPAKVASCRVEIEFAKLKSGPIIGKLSDLPFPDLYCHAANDQTAQTQAPASRYQFGPVPSLGSLKFSLLSAQGSSAFDPAKALALLLSKQHDSLILMIPFSGGYGEQMAFAQSRRGRTFVVMGDHSNPRSRACLVEGLSWNDIAGNSAVPADRKCMDMEFAADRDRPPIKIAPGSITTTIKQ